MKEEGKLSLSRETVRNLGEHRTPKAMQTPKMRQAEGGINTAFWAIFWWYQSVRVQRQLLGESGYMSCRCTDQTYGMEP